MDMVKSNQMNKLSKTIISILAVIGVLGIIATGLIIYGIKTDYTYTGQELFDAVNKHRTSVGAPALELDPILCDNLVERYLSIKEPNTGHAGFEEWAINEGIRANPKYGLLGEMYVKDISTPENAINWWLGSPGHKSTLEMEEMVYGCSYANDGTGVVIMASKKQ